MHALVKHTDVPGALSGVGCEGSVLTNVSVTRIKTEHTTGKWARLVTGGVPGRDVSWKWPFPPPLLSGSLEGSSDPLPHLPPCHMPTSH